MPQQTRKPASSNRDRGPQHSVSVYICPNQPYSAFQMQYIPQNQHYHSHQSNNTNPQIAYLQYQQNIQSGQIAYHDIQFKPIFCSTPAPIRRSALPEHCTTETIRKAKCPGTEANGQAERDDAKTECPHEP